MRAIFIWMLGLALAATAAAGQSGKPGQFDYYVLALSWSPNWCALTGDARGSPQCAPGRDHGWILHGLWPQYAAGWPQSCQTGEAPPSRRMTAEMADIMGTPGLAWHQWNKHGTCSGLSAQGYFALSRAAYGQVNRPEMLRKLTRPVRLPARLIEEAFLQANPALEAEGLTVTCKDGHIEEVRICLSKALAPVRCGRDVIRDCSLDGAVFTPVR